MQLLRSRGLRVTPQRRAILDAFTHGPAEHLSADEVHARAAAAVPELGRGTVYAALAELTELGILSARGSPEPVRYETNTAPHQHFRCRLCLRLFDVDLEEPPTEALTAGGYVVEHVTVSADGVCAECGDYAKGLRAGADRARNRPSPELPDDLATATVDTRLGPLALAATPSGLMRAVFDNHADAATLRDAKRARRGGRAARDHIATAKAAVADFFAGHPPRETTIDWSHLPDAPTLHAVMTIPAAHDASYETLGTGAARQTGDSLGANPVAILIPCHRVTRGSEVPPEYVGGADRLAALRAIERT